MCRRAREVVRHLAGRTKMNATLARAQQKNCASSAAASPGLRRGDHTGIAERASRIRFSTRPATANLVRMSLDESAASRPIRHSLHVWRAVTKGPDADAAHSLASLGPDDHARASRIRDPDARARFAIARAALREILGRYTGALPDRIAFAYSETGKPTLAGGLRGPGFSISHTADLVLVAIWENGVVGIDAERVRAVARQERIERRLFPERISRRLCALPDEERRLAFFHAWTQREAYVKAIGGTLFRTDDPLPLLWPPDFSPQRIRVPDARDTNTASPWTVCTMRPATGFIASVVAQGAVGQVEIRDYPKDLDRIGSSPSEGPA